MGTEPERGYLIGCGFHGPEGDWRRDFFKNLWLPNVRKYSKPSKIIAICDSGCRLPDGCDGVIEIPLTGDLGTCGQLLSGQFTHPFPTGPMVLVTLAMLAYTDNCDFFYAEQDGLFFGDCVGRMSRELEDGGMIFGASRVMESEPSMLFIRWNFIPEFVATYMQSGPENIVSRINETKLNRWHYAMPEKYRKHTIPGGRDRPILFDEPEFYGQKWTPEELAALRERNLI